MKIFANINSLIIIIFNKSSILNGFKNNDF